MQPDSTEIRGTEKWRWLLAAVWAVGFLIYFFNQNLPNNSSGPDKLISRLDICQYLKTDWLIIFNPLDYSATEHKAGWEYLGQRIPFIFTAFAILLAAWCPGRVIRGLALRNGLLFRSESLVIEFGVGISLLTLWVLACGLAGRLTPTLVLLPGIIAAPVAVWQIWRDRHLDAHVAETLNAADSVKLSNTVRASLLLAFAPFVLHILIGGMTPPRDFDVREYHLQGPKEWFQAGRVEMLPHNVYTSFPFLSEMLSLAAMVLTGDWWSGAIAGKLALTSFQLLSALTAYSIGRRWGGRIPGYIAAFALISTPWTVRISIIAYAEGAITFYLIASLMVSLVAAKLSSAVDLTRLVAIAGFLSGSAMSSKYPGLVSVIAPVSIFLLLACWNQTNKGQSKEHDYRRILLNASCFVAAITLAVGPWLLKNVYDTGNPVYPLAYNVFGASNWSPEMDIKWKRAHSAPDHKLTAIPQHLKDVAVLSDWQNGFLFAFGIPAVLLARRMHSVRWLWLYTLWMLATWWALTHRIDRFWIPVLPVLAVLSGLSWKISSSRIWRAILITCLLLCSIYNYGFSRLPVVGFHGGLIELTELKKMPIRQDIRILNQTLPKNARVLMVGEAEVFDADFNVVYNTVFDDSIFQRLTSSDISLPDDQQKMLNANSILTTLKQQSITHVYVNWTEILRYRLTYGFTPYVQPQRLLELQQTGVLENGRPMASMKWNDLSPQEQAEILSWPGNSDLGAGTDYWNNIALYQVRQQ